MNVSVKKLLDYKIQATDGDMGNVHDVLFYEHGWNVCYIAVDTGSWLFGRNVLVSPAAAGIPDGDSERLPVDLTKEQVKDSPDLAADLPLNREQETEYHDYFHWPYYWGGASVAAMAYNTPVDGTAIFVGHDQVLTEDPKGTIPPEKRRELTLRSSKEVIGYTVMAGDSEVGKIDDFVLEPTKWQVAYAVIELEDGKKVLVPTSLITELGPPDEIAKVNLAASMFANAPAYDPDSQTSMDEAARHYSHTV